MKIELEKVLLSLLPQLEELVSELKGKEQNRLAQEQNDASFKEESRRLREKLEKINKEKQDNCDHIAGSNDLSDMSDMARRTSIVWHRLNQEEEIGLCTNCQRQFNQSDSDYLLWRKKPSFNKSSASGRGQSSLVDSGEIHNSKYGPMRISRDLYLKITDDPWLRGDPFYQSIVDFGYQEDTNATV